MKRNVLKNILKFVAIGVAIGGVVKLIIDLFHENINNFEDEDSGLLEDDIDDKPKMERRYFQIFRKRQDKNENLENKKEELKEEKIEESEDIEIKKEDKDENYHKVFYFDFFDSNVLNEYVPYINSFLTSQGEYLNCVKKDVFNVIGDFNVKLLKERFTMQYNSIKQIMEADIMNMPVMKTLPLEHYLDEIDRLYNSDNIEEKVTGLLSYWTVIETSLGQGALI